MPSLFPALTCGLWCLQFLTYAAYRLQLESAFLADELSSAAAAREDLRSSLLHTAMSDVAAVNGNPGGQSEDGKTERSSAQVSQSSANMSPQVPGASIPFPLQIWQQINLGVHATYNLGFTLLVTAVQGVQGAVTWLVTQSVS